MAVQYIYEIKNKKLKKMVENKAQELGIPYYRLIWRYVGRGLLGDNFSEEYFYQAHSKEELDEINKALNVD